jgi:flagellar basal body-associated protein FliL
MTYRARLAVRAVLGCAAVLSATGFPPAIAAEQPAARPAYIALGEFTINLPPNSQQVSYVVISVTVDAQPAAASDLRAVEPRLKEAVMRRLMAMADRGVLQPNHTDLEAIKQSLISILSELHPDSVRDVLIVRLLYG